MSPSQSILDPVPPAARALVFDLRLGADPRTALSRLAPVRGVVGLGAPLMLALGAPVNGLRAFPAVVGPGVAFPSTQGALWAYVTGTTPSEAHDEVQRVRRALGAEFVLREDTHCFRHRDGRDLSGYLDGTANPPEEGARAAAIRPDGSSFVAVQRWVHELERFEAMSAQERDHVIGRRLEDNEEIEDAPEFAHVKRTEQESFENPDGFVVRRSMPWSNDTAHGLYFVAYGESLDRFERQLRRMAGEEDGIVDGLLRFSRAVTGGYYWCPPLTSDGRLALASRS